MLQHDNDPKHRAHIVTKRLDEKGIERLKWSSLFPDLNPIEHIWDKVERRMRKEMNLNLNRLYSRSGIILAMTSRKSWLIRFQIVCMKSFE